MPKTILFLLFLILLLGCSTVITKQGSKVRLTKNEPTDCTLIGDIAETDYWGTGNLVNTRNKLRNTAALMGGDVVTMDTVHQSQITGRVFKCPKTD